MREKPVAVVTGASSGIGAATARQLAEAGYQVIVGARRLDRLREVAEPIGATVLELDVTSAKSVASFCGEIPAVNVLVNNAGGALGLETVADAEDEKWQTMYASNVLGTMRMVRALLPKLEASGQGHIVNIGSIAGFEVYPGGAGYTAAKHAERALTEFYVWNCSANRSALRKSRQDWWKPNSVWCASAAMRNARKNPMKV